MNGSPSNTRRLAWGFVFLALAVALWVWQRQPGGEALTPEKAAELGVAHLPDGTRSIQSSFSNMLIEERGTVRSLYFVADNGSRALESSMDLTRPHELLIPYTQTMFASHLFVPEPEHVLIIGLGGGSMVRFLQAFDPNLRVDAVEIDPAVITVADELFGTRPSSTVRIIEQDGFDFLANSTVPYDVIYMDAFLEPSDATDENGVPLDLKTVDFLRDLGTKTRPGGVVVFNVSLDEDIAAIAEAFNQTYLFKFNAPGRVAVATLDPERMDVATLEETARTLEARAIQTPDGDPVGLPFTDMVRRLHFP